MSALRRPSSGAWVAALGISSSLLVGFALGMSSQPWMLSPGVIGVGIAALALFLYVAYLRYGPAVLAAPLLAAALGLIPGIDNRRMLVQGVEQGDLAVVALLGVFMAAAAKTRFRGLEASLSRRVLALSALLLAWWIGVLLLTIASGTPPLKALRTGRDFAAFAVMLPAASLALADRRFRVNLLVAFGLIAVPSAVIQATAALAAPDLIGTFVHSVREYQPKGVARLDTDADDFMTAAFLLGTFAVLAGSRGKARWVGVIVALAGLSYVIFTFTRMRYITVPLALVAVLLLSPGRLTSLRRTAVLALCVVGGVVMVAAVAPSGTTKVAGQAIGDRFASLLGSASSDANRTDTVAVREGVASTLTERLDEQNRWLTGLGFLSATSTYDPDLPGGSIRNPDVGVLNAVVTMGLIGTALLYALVLVPVLEVSKGVRRRAPGRWLLMGVLAYGVFVIASSVTLAGLMGFAGLVTTAVVLGLGVGQLVDRSEPPGGMAQAL